MNWQQAMDYYGGLDTGGHGDWRVATSGELNVLFQNRARIGGFSETGDAEWSWSSTEHGAVHVSLIRFGGQVDYAV